MKLAFAALLAALVVGFVVSTARGLARIWGRPPVLDGVDGVVASLGLARRGPAHATGLLDGRQVEVHVGPDDVAEVTLRTGQAFVVAAQSLHGDRDLRSGDPAFDGIAFVDGDPDRVHAWLDAPTRARVAALVRSGARHERGRWRWTRRAADVCEVASFVREAAAATDRWPAADAVPAALLGRALLDVVEEARVVAAARLLDRWAVEAPDDDARALLAAARLPDDLRARLAALGEPAAPPPSVSLGGR